MFIGMIGYTYVAGFSSIWILIGWIFGDFLMSLFVHKKVRIISQKQKAVSFSSILGNWHGTDYKKLRVVCGIITILFLSIYAAAQFKAGGKALNVILGWDYYIGSIMGAVLVLLYCFSGGIRASIWADAAQSFVMIAAMTILFFTAVDVAGGFSIFIDKLDTISPHYLSLFLTDSDMPVTASLLFITGWLFAGFGVVGQPHIMVRFMTIDSPKSMTRARVYYYSWYTVFSILTIGAGLAARVLIPETNNFGSEFDPELALPTLSKQLLPDVLVGLILAGLFAATISTADSQILSCCASLTNDFSDSNKKSSYLITKLGTLLITILALTIALGGGNSVFELVVVAWSVLSSAFAPLLIIYAFGGKPSERTAIAMVVGGVGALFLWRFYGLHTVMFESFPGILVGILIYLFCYHSHCSKK